MGQFVSSEITISSKDFSALIAFKRLVVGVGQKMRLQVGALVEASLTHGTLVRGFLHV